MEVMRIGLIGAGRMGLGMGLNLLQARHELVVLAHQSRANVDQLVSEGAIEADCLSTLVERSDVVLCCLPTIASVAEVIGGPGGVIEHANRGALIVDTSTSTPSLAQIHASNAEKKGVGFVDAALMKGPPMAMAGRLNVIIGGTDADVARATQVLDCFSEQIFHVGAVGGGCTVKLLNQAIGLGTHAIVCEAFALGAKLGLDLDALFQIVDSGQASSVKLKTLSEKFLSDNYRLDFAIDTATKDIGTASRMALDAEIHAPTMQAAASLFSLGRMLGEGEKDVSEIAPLLARLGKVDFREASRQSAKSKSTKGS